MKKSNQILLLFSSLILIVSCRSEFSKKQEEAQMKAAAIEKMQARFDSASQSGSSAISLKHAEKRPDSTLVDADLDIEFKTSTLVHFDKNGVEWKNPEKNEFRFVYKIKLNKLIIYKNSIEFKTYDRPIIYTTGRLVEGKMSPFDFGNIYVGGKKIVSGEDFGNIDFAPNGLNNYSDYYYQHLEKKTVK